MYKNSNSEHHANNSEPSAIAVQQNKKTAENRLLYGYDYTLFYKNQ